MKVKRVYTPSNQTLVTLWCSYQANSVLKKKILKAVFKALVSVFHVKVWIEKCQDVTNEHK